MSDATFWGLFLLGSLTLWFAAVMFAVGLGKAASQPAPPMPWDAYFGGGELPTLADRMTAARDWDPVAAAEAIVKEAAR